MDEFLYKPCTPGMPQNPMAQKQVSKHDEESAELVRIAVVSARTGVPQPTLRAWERRYGVPKPHRTDSGYRLYSAREVLAVAEMRRRCDEGLPASEAARLVRADFDNKDGDAVPSSPALLDPFVASQDAILDAIHRFDDGALDIEVRRLLMLAPPLEVLYGVVNPVLRAIGERWQAGTLTIAHEHLASQRLSTLLRDLIALSIRGTARSKALVACFDEDEHEMGALGTGLQLAVWGMRPIVLGACTPPSALKSAIVSTNPSLVALSLTYSSGSAKVRQLFSEYARACGRIPLVFGGFGAAKLASYARKLGAHVEPSEREFQNIVRDVLARSR